MSKTLLCRDLQLETHPQMQKYTVAVTSCLQADTWMISKTTWNYCTVTDVFGDLYPGCASSKIMALEITAITGCGH